MLHRAETERLGLSFLDLVQDHRGAETLQVRQHLLGFLIELEVAIFERMVDDLARLVMLDADRRLGASAIAAWKWCFAEFISDIGLLEPATKPL